MRKASKAASSNIRIIPDLLNGKGARSPKCCDRGIMRRSQAGVKARPRSIHGHGDRTFGSAISELGSSLPLARGKRRTNEMNLIQTLEAEQIAELSAKGAMREFPPGE